MSNMRAMLLAAGRGERMRPLTDHTPKPLLLVNGKPLIVWHIERLVNAGITELVINHAHLGVQIERALGDGHQFGATITYSPEVTALETAGGIANALHLLGKTPFAVINSDIFCDYDLSQLPIFAAQMIYNHDMLHLVLVDNPSHNPNGDFGLDNSRVIDSLKKLTFSGIGLYQPSLFSNMQPGSKAPLAPLLRDQIMLGNVSGEHYHGMWMDIGTPSRLLELETLLNSDNTYV